MNIPKYQPGKSVKNGIKLSSNEAPLGISSHVVQAITHNLTSCHRYPEHTHHTLKEIIALRHNIEPTQIIFGNGSDEIISFITHEFLEHNDSVIVGTPSFSIYTTASLLAKAKINTVALKNWHFDLQAIHEHIQNDTKIIFLCSPNNPTGTCIDPHTLTQFLRNIPSKIYVVLDFAYIDFIDKEYYIPYNNLLHLHQNIILLHTMSKAYAMAGLRVGYAIASNTIISKLEQQRMPFNLNRLALVATQAAFEDTTHYNNTIQIVKQERTRLMRFYKKLQCNPILSQANFITLFPKPKNTIHIQNNIAETIFQQFMQHDPPISVRPLNSFGIDNAVRITIGTEYENNLVMDKLQKIVD